MQPANKILIADDDDDFRILLKDFLSDQGFHVVEVSDGGEVFDKTLAENPDIVLLDIMMPNRNGFDICRDIKKDVRTRKSVVVMLSCKSGLTDKLSSYVAGAQRYIGKPCDLEEVKDCLKSVLRQRQISTMQFEEDQRQV